MMLHAVSVNTLLCQAMVWPFSLYLDKDKAFSMLYRLGQEQNLRFHDTDKRSTQEKCINTSQCLGDSGRKGDQEQ